MHLPRSYQTVVELKTLAAVPTQIVSPQSSQPVMGLVQDSMLACYRWTKSKNLLSARQVMKLMSWTSTYNGELPPPDDISDPNNPKWTAQSVLSTILPEFTFKTDEVDIEHGQFKAGIWSKGTVGGKLSKLIHAVWKDFGPEATRLFMDNLMNLMVQWLLMDGFSIGVVDFNIDQATTDKIQGMIKKAYEQSSELIRKVRLGELKPKLSTMPIKEEFENQMFDLLNVVRNEAQDLDFKNMDPDTNRLHNMVAAGSKGSKANIVQIASVIGQQVIEQARIHEGYRYRTLPHFPKHDLTPDSHGFIENNFLHGLTPAEYFFVSMAGRIGVINTAIKTAVTGYTQRKLIKVLEDLKVSYDNTVRNANNFIVDHVYGGDGFDGAKLEIQKFDYMTMNPLKFAETYMFPEGTLQNFITPEAYVDWEQTGFGAELLREETEQLLEDRRVLREMHRSYAGKEVYSPVHFGRLLNWVRYTFNLDKYPLADVHPTEIIQKVRGLIADLQVSEDPTVNEICTRHFRFLIRSFLSSKRLITKYHINQEALDVLLLRIKQLYLDGRVAPGEMVGIIAAQSIGQPMTQLTLDLFHKSGLGTRSRLTNEMPRLKEIFSVTAHPKTPSLTIYLDHLALGLPGGGAPEGEPMVSHEQAIARGQDILDGIQYTTFNNLIEKDYQILFDPHVDEETVVSEDRKWLKEMSELDEFLEPNESPWLLRFYLNSEKIRNLDLNEVAGILNDMKLSGDLRIQVKHSGANLPEVVVRVRVDMPSDAMNPLKIVKDVGKKILMTQVKGVKNIIGGEVLPVDRGFYVNGEYVTTGEKRFKQLKYFNPDDENKQINPASQNYIFVTDGVNLFDILARTEFLRYQTKSNDIHETLHTLGIEAARQIIINEINQVLEDGGATMNPRHLGILANIMTAQGHLVSVDRYGMGKTDTGPWSRATFEETTTQITNAAIYSEFDPMTGMSPNIMFGQYMSAGTTSFNFYLDEEMLMDATQLYQPLMVEKAAEQSRQIEVQEGDMMKPCGRLDFNFEPK